MTTATPTADALTALRGLTLDQVEARLAELDVERAGLSWIRRSLVAREKARRRQRRLAGKAAGSGQA
jgi:hypothetical protein